MCGNINLPGGQEQRQLLWQGDLTFGVSKTNEGADHQAPRATKISLLGGWTL